MVYNVFYIGGERESSEFEKENNGAMWQSDVYTRTRK